MGIDKRVEKNSASVVALASFLREVTMNASNYCDDRELIAVLRSQGALAGFSREQYGIYGSSLNTVKRIAASTIDGGFEALNMLRVKALDTIAGHNKAAEKSSKKNKAGLTARVTELEEDKQVLLEELLLLTNLLEKSFIQGLNYAKASNDLTVLHVCNREQRQLKEMLSLRRVNKI